MEPQLINFRSENEWMSYFGKDLADLYAKVTGFLELKSEVEEIVDERALAELVETSSIWEKVFFGGLTRDENNPLAARALAGFYRDIFGLGVEDEELATVISLLNQGVPLENSLREIRPIIYFGIEIILEDVAKKLKRIFDSLRGVVPAPEPKKFAVEDHLFGPKALGEVLNSAKRVLPLYNSLSFFIMSTYSIPRFYALKEYPELEDERAKAVLENFGISITDIVDPGLPDSNINKERSIIGHSEWSTGALVRDVIIRLFALFQWPMLSDFFTSDGEEGLDEFLKYINLYVKRIKRVIELESFTDLLTDLRSLSHSYGSGLGGSIYLHDWLNNRMEGLKWPRVMDPLEFRYDKSVRVERGTVLLTNNRKVNYSEFVSFLSPLAFTGLSYVRPAQDKPDTYVLCLLVGWERVP